MAAAARAARHDRSPLRPTLGAIAFWSALSFLPDADVVGFGFGVQYGDEWGHRGATHSFVFSIALGAVLGALAPRFGRPAVRTGVLASVVLASHALLDIFTNGGLGCALFWPFDLTRYFAPWTPIPVSPIGLGYLSPYGMFVAAAEIVIFAPVFWFAMAARRPGVLAAGVWLVGLWLLFSTDPVRERIVRAALRDDTVYAGGFTEAGLSAVERGEHSDRVRTRLGAPLRVLPFRGRDECWLYSASPDDGYFRARAVCFEDGRVSGVIRRWLRE
jgi:inner membrane protein